MLLAVLEAVPWWNFDRPRHPVEFSSHYLSPVGGGSPSRGRRYRPGELKLLGTAQGEPARFGRWLSCMLN